MSDGLEINSIDDLVELKLGELIVLVAIGVVLCKELLGFGVTTLFDYQSAWLMLVIVRL